MQIPSRKEIIQKIKSKAGKIAAVLPYHYPRALLRAHGIFPIEVWGPPHVDDMAGSQHFPEYTCKIVQKATQFLTGPMADPVDCILVPHTCDSLQGMASVMKDFMPSSRPLFTLYHPRGRRQSDLVFLTAELTYLSRELTQFSGVNPTDRDLKEAMAIENLATELFAGIATNRKDYDLSDRAFYTLLRSREYLPAEDFISLARELPRGRPDLKGPALMISGIVADPLDLFDHINDFGAHVIGDDLGCCSRRIYTHSALGKPFAAMAEQLMSMPPDPTVSSPYKDRFDHIVNRMKSSRARGLLVYDPKFCEPELFYLPMLEEAVVSAGFGFFYVETELSPTIPQTVLNRINAFIEVIS